MASRPVVVNLGAAPGARTPSAPPAEVGVSGPVSLTSGPFTLRSLVSADATQEVVDWFNDGAMLRGLNLGDLAFTRDSLRRFIDGFDNRRNYLVGIFETASGRLVGFYTLDIDLTHRTGGITTGIGVHAFRGKGVLWATIDVLLDDFFERRGIDKISARIVSRNFRMLFNFKDNPRFIMEALLRRECRAPDGSRVDIMVFSAFREGVLGGPGT